jgi:tetratricopeptide (TPR) repeat protein/2-polyprenyl-3-methyl-5-hydroxy-6-metoxy-1,4-benzoquinol methylase
MNEPPAFPPPFHATFPEALRLHQAGRLADAEKLCRQVLAADPNHADGLHLLGLIAYQTRHYDAAIDLIGRAIRLKDSNAIYHGHLGVVLNEQGKLAAAVASYDRALALNPDYVEAHYNLGNALKDQGRLTEAVASYDCSLALKPDFAEAYINRGNALKDQGKLAEAVASFERALFVRPDFAEAHYNRGNALKDQGKLPEAVACYERALVLKPDYAEAYNNLALTMMEQGQAIMAVNIIKQSLRARETPEAKRLFVACVRRLRGIPDESDTRAATIRALTEPWDQPGKLAGHAIDLVKRNPDIAGCVARAVDAWPHQLSTEQLFGANGLAALAADPLLLALLQSTTISDFDMERFLTMARRALLEISVEAPSLHNNGDGATIHFYAALARQCFINEYVFSRTEEEVGQASAVRASLVAAVEGAGEIPALWLIAVASYFPLSSVSQATQLLEREWPPDVLPLLTQQVREPAEEAALRAAIPRLTDVEGEVSLGVQKQYEENPYPRWINVAPGAKATNIVSYLATKFPAASIRHHSASSHIDMLIAGCGTGQHSIGTALALPTAHVLAIDLSMSSLGYALRKTRELGLTSIEYAQADILKLGSLHRRFDVIESSGVLHHLKDPWTGWRALLSVLRPGGFMKLGLYSAIARQDIVSLRELIAERGYAAIANDIRRCRQELMALGRSAPSALASPDFFSTSGCRDMLFHVQEHQMTLPDIESFLQESGLTFLGFEVDGDVRAAYRSRFPNDLAGTNLGQWQLFEHDNPSTFNAMYQFWIQKPA